MKNRWSDKEASTFKDDLSLRVYSSRLLGQEPNLVLHGGGNTSVKSKQTDLFGNTEEILYVKGSGWDLATIEAAGFAPVKLSVLMQMARLEELSDSDMVRAQRAAMIDPEAPTPSIEAILHAIIPFNHVDHSHADAVVTLTNTADGEARIRDLYGERVIIVPYVMPGFALARQVFLQTENLDWSKVEGMVLMNHGLFTFSDEAKRSYTRMIDLVTQAEDYLKTHAKLESPPAADAKEDLLALAQLRQVVSMVRGGAVVAQWAHDVESIAFSNRSDMKDIATRGPLTPDHVIRTKIKPLVLEREPGEAISNYIMEYQHYYGRNAKEGMECLNPAPCWAVWPGFGCVSFGRSSKEAKIVADITAHTRTAICRAEALGGWRALPEKALFEIEYWELEQAKLKKGSTAKPLQGKVAVVTGAAIGIGRACVEALLNEGAVVAALDRDEGILQTFSQPEVLPLQCDVTEEEQVKKAIAETVRRFGGLDILISSAGIFFATESIEEQSQARWEASLAVNLTGHQRLLRLCAPYLKLGIEPAVVMVASKNVSAPGRGAAAYSVAKSGQTQLARVAALELGEAGIRVNVLHPNAVFDTGLWTPELLAERAKRYGLTVEQYKTSNILGAEVRSNDVAALACAMVGPLFSRTTGAQVPIDGGNERVI